MDKTVIVVLILITSIGLLTTKNSLIETSVFYNLVSQYFLDFGIPIGSVEIDSLYNIYTEKVEDKGTKIELSTKLNSINQYFELQIFEGCLQVFFIIIYVSIILLTLLALITITYSLFWLGLKSSYYLKLLFKIDDKIYLPVFGLLLWSLGELLSFTLKTYSFFVIS